MQTRGGGKRDIVPVGRVTATTLDCLWMMPRDPDADMYPQHGNGAGEHGGVHGASELRPVCGSNRDRSNPGAVHRALSQARV